MIDVQHLTKRYGQHVALDGVSFSVNAGEVVGFLGPNGAGKSTTMRILTTFMAATSGTVRVGGDCVFEQPYRVRERIGYMPENNPLPLDLRVADYLGFRAELKPGQARDRRSSQRSDGTVRYWTWPSASSARLAWLPAAGWHGRCAVGQAELIVLPTSGLDPNQVRSVRRLIRELAGEHTVLISSHILSEIEMTCDRVVILHEGRLLASGALNDLMAKANATVTAEMQAPLPEVRQWAAELALGQAEIAGQPDGYVRCQFTEAIDGSARERVFAAANERGWPLRELSRRPSLED